MASYKVAERLLVTLEHMRVLVTSREHFYMHLDKSRTVNNIDYTNMLLFRLKLILTEGGPQTSLLFRSAVETANVKRMKRSFRHCPSRETFDQLYTQEAIFTNLWSAVEADAKLL